MLILAIDTTSEVGGVGIFYDTETVALIPNEARADRYSVSLFEMVEKALVQAQRGLADIELYAAANGPGSFTGIRVGLAAARAWAKVFARPVHGVSVMEAMVEKQRGNAPEVGLGPPAPDWYFPILDARRGEFFLGSFRRQTPEVTATGSTEYEPVDVGRVLKPDDLRSSLAARVSGGQTGTGLVRAHDQTARELCATLPVSLNWRTVDGVLMDAIAGVALREHRCGRTCSNAKLDAYYIRRPDAEIKLIGD